MNEIKATTVDDQGQRFGRRIEVMNPTAAAFDSAHHSDNQRRFITLEEKVDANTALTKTLVEDMSGLLEMWKDAGVVFKWLRRIGGFVVWLRNVTLAVVALYIAWKYGSNGRG